MNRKNITIAVDGFAACGKSTLAKALAKSLNYAYVDSGAMYRAVTLHFLQSETDIQNPKDVEMALNDCHIHFELVDGNNHTFLNDIDVEKEIRSMRVSDFVSPVATISMVRRAMVKQQQQMGRDGGIAMDGRDIGTVVFKEAELKLFLTASIEERTRRRLLELEMKGIHEFNAQQVEENLRTRDHIDSTRGDSPLQKAEDAIELDNSLLNPDQQLSIAIKLARAAIQKKTASLLV